MGTQYWVYINSSQKKAQLHKAKCGSCKYGQTLRSNSATSNDWWEGPFDSRNSAWECAQSAATKVGGVPTRCALCHP